MYIQYKRSPVTTLRTLAFKQVNVKHRNNWKWVMIYICETYILVYIYIYLVSLFEFRLDSPPCVNCSCGVADWLSCTSAPWSFCSRGFAASVWSDLCVDKKTYITLYLDSRDLANTSKRLLLFLQVTHCGFDQYSLNLRSFVLHFILSSSSVAGTKAC